MGGDAGRRGTSGLYDECRWGARGRVRMPAGCASGLCDWCRRGCQWGLVGSGGRRMSLAGAGVLLLEGIFLGLLGIRSRAQYLFKTDFKIPLKVPKRWKTAQFIQRSIFSDLIYLPQDRFFTNKSSPEDISSTIRLFFDPSFGDAHRKKDVVTTGLFLRDRFHPVVDCEDRDCTDETWWGSVERIPL